MNAEQAIESITAIIAWIHEEQSADPKRFKAWDTAWWSCIDARSAIIEISDNNAEGK